MTSDEVLLARPDLTDAQLNELFTASWPTRRPPSFGPMLARSLTWIAARRGARLVGFVNVVGDGGGAEWLHVDYEPHLESFYAQCGFRPTTAGLMRL